MRAALPQDGARAQGALNLRVTVGELDRSADRFQHAGQRRTATARCRNTAMARRDARRVDGAAGAMFLHHPPFVTGITHMDRAEPAQRRRARRHAASSSARAAGGGRPCPSCRADAVCRHAGDDLPGAEPRRRARCRRRTAALAQVEPPAFHLHAWFPGEGFGRVVTHWMPIGDFEGPYPFFGGTASCCKPQRSLHAIGRSKWTPAMSPMSLLNVLWIVFGGF